MTIFTLVNIRLMVNNSLPVGGLVSLDNIAFSEIHNAALCYRSLQRSHFWSRDPAQRLSFLKTLSAAETLVFSTEAG